MSQLIRSEDCRQILFSMSQQRSAENVLRTLVQGLFQRCGAALARIWLVNSTAVVDTTLTSRHQTGEQRMLKLVASAGRSLDGTDWEQLDGRFAMIPFGFGKVGYIAETRLPVEEKAIGKDSPWIADPAWVEREQICGLIGQPLLHDDQVLGVLAVFTRESPTDDDLAWLKAFADHAAITIANRNALTEIQDLRRQLETENEYLRLEVKDAHAHGEIIGDSHPMVNLRNRIRLVAPTDATVLIQGESGTGKELVARALHEQSTRAQHPLITVNCAAIPRDLFESEFFGHVKGAFSGATQHRLGRFQLANHGTLLLDEVGEIPLEMQGKLLRVLEQGSFERVGDEKTTHVHVRVIAATNRSLADEVQAGRFRKDLYYRLCVFLLDVPALSERAEDIELLARHFLGVYRRKYHIRAPQFTKRNLEDLRSYSWPGNVRELRNVVERAVIMCATGGVATLEFAPVKETRQRAFHLREAPESQSGILTDAELRQFERQNLIRVLKQTGWKIAGAGGAAEVLGIHPATLASRMRSLQLIRSRNEQSDD